MDPLDIWIYLRRTPNDFLEKFCAATLIRSSEPFITFQTESYLSLGSDLHYYVQSIGSAPEDESPQFREMEIYPNLGREKIYTYTVKLGQACAGTVAAAKIDKRNDAESSA